MRNMIRRVTAGAFLTAAPVLIALGAAAASHADETGVTNNGPVVTQSVQHPAFPIQTNIPAPGSVEHHHHQWNHS
jgi:hypothetical protein